MTFAQLSPATLNRIERIESALKQTKKGTRSLLERMSDLTIPGVSIAVIHEYQIEWERGYGVRERGTEEQVDAETRFQACSISKPVTAIATLRLVEQGRLDLDTDINTYLTSWRLPKNGAWQPEVTLRQLLSHTAGISVPWFNGYHPEQDIPTLREVLDSQQPANTVAIRVTTIPGLRFRYSGGGYVIVQQLLMDVMKQPFPQLMRDLVFNPLNMQHSTYEQPRGLEQWEHAATGHRSSGKPIAGKWHIFPEMAAGGLWTTASDLARFALSLQKAKAGQPDQILSSRMVEKLLTPQSKSDDRGDIGLGVFIEGRGNTARFGHGGDNFGYACHWVSLKYSGQGCVIMTNSDNGWALLNELVRAIAQVYDWPAVASRKTRPASDTLSVTDDYAGTYELQPGLSLTVTKRNNTLFLQVPDQQPIELLRGNDTTYLLAGMDDTLTFVRNEAGKVVSLIFQQGTTEERAIKRKDA